VNSEIVISEVKETRSPTHLLTYLPLKQSE